MRFRPPIHRQSASNGHLLGLFDTLFGVLLPIPIFLQVQGKIGLYSEGFESTGLSLPIGFFLLPFAVAIGALHWARQRTLQPAHLFTLISLILWWCLLALYTSMKDSAAVLYAVQWSAPPLAILYAGSLMQDEQRLARFIRCFYVGTLGAMVYLIGLASYEFLFMDSFSGRMTQNAVLPGTYQLYNYVPEGLVASGIFCAFFAANRGSKVFGMPMVFLGLSFLVPMATGARGPLLVTLLCTAFFVYRYFSFAFFLTCFVVGPCVLFALLHLLPGDQFLLVDKFLSIGSSDEFGGLAGNRDVMASLYWHVFEQEPFIGTGMLPPDLAFPELDINVKSAHNYYLDSLAWGGPLALLGVILLPIFGLCELFLNQVMPPHGEKTIRHIVFASAAPPALATLFVSSLLRVPLREPYSGPIGYLFLGFILAGGFQLRSQRLRKQATAPEPLG